MSAILISRIEELEAILSSPLGPPEALVIEYYLPKELATAERFPILEFVLSEDGEQSVYFGGGQAVQLHPKLLQNVITTSFERLHKWSREIPQWPMNLKDGEQ